MAEQNKCRICGAPSGRYKTCDVCRAKSRDRNKAIRKTVDGFLERLYYNMYGRVTGIQTIKSHLYLGKEILPKAEFFSWAKNDEEFLNLFTAYVESDCERRLAPSVDRVDSDKGYTLDNMEWVTASENSRRGAISPKRKRGKE